MYDFLTPSNAQDNSPWYLARCLPPEEHVINEDGKNEWALEIEARSYVRCALSIIKSHVESHFLPIHLPQPELPCSIIIQGNCSEGPLLAGQQGAAVQSQLCSKFISVSPASRGAQKNDPL